MYLVTDSYGTRIACWTLADAIDWLRYCAPEAYISNRLTGRILRARFQ